MSGFNADLRDIRFVLFDQLNFDELLKTERFSSFTRQDVDMILDEAYRMAKEVLGPANAPGDREGSTLKDGKVTTPKAYKDAFKHYREGGWIGLNRSTEFGGQGAPDLVRIASDDMLFGSNIALNLGLLLTPGAAQLIENFGTDAVKQTYVRNMYEGKWSGTMCLTEPQAGSDVGAATTKAKRAGDHYLIEGNKIFITFGEHDLTENIIHCVLARIEGAPSGTKGLSLFVVPKYRVNTNGSVGDFNEVVCTGVEHKMGIHGSPTCSMSFGANGPCHGWLLGEENGGMRLMFQMMNEARVAVGMQGAALGNAAYQAALEYAKDRVQGPDIRRFKDPTAPKVPIIQHPDVRMNLARMKAYGEGCRALLFFAAYCYDMSHASGDESKRQRYNGMLELLTPICKAYCADMGFRMTEWSVQIYGGYGYLKDFPAEQYMRDCKIASIYEGTNGIQAIDLIGRKLMMNGGANLMSVMQMITEFTQANASHPVLGSCIEGVTKATATWGAVNASLAAAAGSGQLLKPLVTATSYLNMCGDLLMGYFLTQQATIAWRQLEPKLKGKSVDYNDSAAVIALCEKDDEVRYLDGKIKTAKFFCAYELPRVESLAVSIKTGDTSAIDMVF